MSKRYGRAEMKTAYNVGAAAYKYGPRIWNAARTIQRAWRGRPGPTDARTKRKRIAVSALARTKRRRALSRVQPRGYMRGRSSRLAKSYPRTPRPRIPMRPKWALKEWQDMLGKRIKYEEVGTESLNRLWAGHQWKSSWFGYPMLTLSDLEVIYTRFGLTNSGVVDASYPMFQSQCASHWRYLNIGNMPAIVEIFVAHVRRDVNAGLLATLIGSYPSAFNAGITQQVPPTGTTAYFVDEKGLEPFKMQYIRDLLSSVKRVSRKMLQPGEHGNFNLAKTVGLFHKGQYQCKDADLINAHVELPKTWPIVYFRVTGFMVHDNSTITTSMNNTDTNPSYGSYAVDIIRTTQNESWRPIAIGTSGVEESSKGWTGNKRKYTNLVDEHVQLENAPYDAATTI